MKYDLRGVPPWDELKARLEIGRIFKLLDEDAPTDHIEQIVADAYFDLDQPYSINFRPDMPTFQCMIVLNASKKDYFARWPKDMSFQRLLWILRAYFDSVLHREDWEAGAQAELASFGVSPDITIGVLVSSARSAYVVNRRIDAVLGKHLSTADGSPLSLRHLLEDPATPPVTEALVEELTLLPEEIDRRRLALERGSSDEPTFWGACSGALHGILYSLTTVAAAYDETSDWAAIQARLFNDRNFAAYLGSAWPALHADWRASLLRDAKARREADAEIRAVVRSIFEKLGIRILDRPQGASVLQLVRPEGLTH